MKKTKLAVIMFTDIFGFSKMMEADEQKTIEMLDSHNNLVFPLVEQYNGRIVDTVGDGLLVIFESALEAAECAINIQRTVAEYNVSVDQGYQFNMRIGLHLGDIWYDEERVYGNGVNITARIEPYAIPGGICVSESMYHQLKNKVDLDMKSIGSKPLKNIEQDILLYHIITGVEIKQYSSDVIKVESEKREKILQARDEIRHKLAESESKPDTKEAQLERKILGFVDKVMDKAIDKWDNLPEEKKEKILQENTSHNISIELGSKKKKKNKADLAPGIIFSLAFGAGFFYWNIGWMIVPFVLMGLLPFTIESGKLIKNIRRNKQEALEAPRKNRRIILEAAQKVEGKITVVKLASLTDLDIDIVQNTLDEMVAKGYIVQHLEDSGVLHYEFPE